MGQLRAWGRVRWPSVFGDGLVQLVLGLQCAAEVDVGHSRAWGRARWPCGIRRWPRPTGSWPAVRCRGCSGPLRAWGRVRWPCGIRRWPRPTGSCPAVRCRGCCGPAANLGSSSMALLVFGDGLVQLVLGLSAHAEVVVGRLRAWDRVRWPCGIRRWPRPTGSWPSVRCRGCRGPARAWDRARWPCWYSAMASSNWFLALQCEAEVDVGSAGSRTQRQGCSITADCFFQDHRGLILALHSRTRPRSKWIQKSVR